MLLQEFLSRKQLSRKYRSIFGLTNLSCEEEEGTGISSDVVEVEGEDPVTPGLLP